jgi:hypothetical protein
MANIQLNKKVYGAKSAGDMIDKSFSELFRTKEPVNVERLFSLYNELFYDISKEGDNSHTTFIQRSTDYIRDYVDPKDAQIDALIDRIEDLEEELSSDNNQEHPFFSNGSFISTGVYDGSPVYIMEGGKKRSINGWDLIITIMKAKGITENYEEQVLILQSSTIAGIPSAPKPPGNTWGIEEESDLNFYQDMLSNTIISETQNFFSTRTSLDALTLSEGQLVQLRDLLDEKEAAGLITKEDIISNLETTAMEGNNNRNSGGNGGGNGGGRESSNNSGGNGR